MKMNKKNYIGINKLVILTIFISIFILPINFLRERGFNLDQYIFALIAVIYYFNYSFNSRKIKIKDFILLIFIVYFCIINRSFSHIHLIGLCVIDKMINRSQSIVEDIYKSKILFFSLFFVIIYTLIYFGEGSRYLFTGIREVNQGGLSLILLFLIIRSRYKKLGNILLVIGIITFSRSYLLGLILFIFIDVFKKRRGLMGSLLMNRLKNFRVLAIYSIIGLILLSSYFTDLYQSGRLDSYGQGIERFASVTDYSNYLRFTVNTNLIEVYKREPKRLLFGISNEEFFHYNSQIARIQGQAYRAIKPHNYFFSYFQIYGIFSIVIFWYVSTIFKRIITKDNLPVFIVIFTYITFLGIGVTSYWIFLSIFAMLSYRKNFELEDKHG